MLTIMSLSTDPEHWRFAALLIGGLFSIVFSTFVMMYALMRPRTRD